MSDMACRGPLTHNISKEEKRGRDRTRCGRRTPGGDEEGTCGGREQGQCEEYREREASGDAGEAIDKQQNAAKQASLTNNTWGQHGNRATRKAGNTGDNTARRAGTEGHNTVGGVGTFPGQRLQRYIAESSITILALKEIVTTWSTASGNIGRRGAGGGGED